MSGKGKHYIDNTSLYTEKGDVFVIPPNISHGYYPEERLDIYHILIKNDFLSKYNYELSKIDGSNLLFDIEPQIRSASGKRLNLNVGTNILYDFKENIKDMIKAEKYEKYVYLNILALAFIGHLCDKMNTISNELCDEEIIRVIEYIKSNLDKKLTNNILANLMHVSTATLIRRFHSVIGLSPMRYVIDCRIKAAQKLIAENNLTKTEIAERCGFYDVSHLNKYINKQTGRD